MQGQVKKSLWIVTAIASLLTSIVCFIVTEYQNRPQDTRLGNPFLLLTKLIYVILYW